MSVGTRQAVITIVGIVAAVASAQAAVKTVTIERRLPINQYCPIDNGDFDLTFVAEGPVARLTIEAFNTTTGGTFIQNRIDNIAVVAKSTLDTHLVAPPGFAACYAAPGDPNTPAFDFNASGTTEAFLDLFDSNANRWDRNHLAYYQGSVSAPRSPATGSDTTGGALSLGDVGDGNVVATTSVLIPNLTAGTEYVITGWWNVKDATRPLTLTIDTACLDDDLDGVSDCAGDCGVHDAATKPGAVETCDGIDNDCDGQIDEDAPCDRVCDVPSPLVAEGRLSTTSVGSTHPRIVWTGSRYLVVFEDGVSTLDVFLAKGSSAGGAIGGEQPLVATAQNETEPRAVWTGSEIAVLWRAGNQLMFARFDRDGRPIADPLVVGGWSSLATYDLAWTGSEYGVLWAENPAFLFRRLDANGTPLTPPLALFTSVPPGAQYVWRRPRLAWNGTHYGALWEHGTNSTATVLRFRRIDPLDVMNGSALDLGVPAGTASNPVIAGGGGNFGIAWSDHRDGPGGEIYFSLIGPAGTEIVSDLRVTNAAGGSLAPTLAWSGAEWGLAWDDLRTGNEEIWFGRVSSGGAKLGSDLQVTNAPGHSRDPDIVWAGGKFAIAWSDDRTGGNDEVYFTPLGCDCVDGDGDGASSCIDCADNDPATYPGAPDACNGIANHNCNSAFWPNPAPIGDLDGDGLSPCAGDCDDASAAVYPGAPQLCDDLNNDCNSPMWPSANGTNDEDLDFDGFTVCENDCSDVDADNWGTPSEVTLRVTHSFTLNRTTIQVSPPAFKGSRVWASYTMRSESAADFVANTVCLTSTTDSDVPALGAVFFYLARAVNGCPGVLGIGDLGDATGGIPRTSRTCP